MRRSASAFWRFIISLHAPCSVGVCLTSSPNCISLFGKAFPPVPVFLSSPLIVDVEKLNVPFHHQYFGADMYYKYNCELFPLLPWTAKTSWKANWKSPLPSLVCEHCGNVGFTKLFVCRFCIGNKIVFRSLSLLKSGHNLVSFTDIVLFCVW